MRASRKRESLVSHAYQLELRGSTRCETRCWTRRGRDFDASSTRNASYSLPSAGVGARSKTSLPPDARYSVRVLTPSFGGQASNERHWLEPISKIIASGRGVAGRSLRYWAKNGA